MRERLPLRRCRVEDPAQGAWLEAACVRAGEDLVVVVGGGQRPHVGAAALAVSVQSAADPAARSQSSYLAAVPGHREEDLARTGALRLCRALGRQVVVTVGIHDDAITRPRIDLYLRLFDRLMGAVEAAHSPRRGPAATPGAGASSASRTARRRSSAPKGLRR